MSVYAIAGKHENYNPDNFITTSAFSSKINFEDIENAVIVICSSDSKLTRRYIWIEYRELFTVDDFLDMSFGGDIPVGFYILSYEKNLGEKIAEDIRKNNPYFKPL